ncbi:hypothetical protein L2E82_01922 [Cichorium intybus]|uniref:Uncharacterized protein n=1 Tax=Cichorium intybus TaxID=13427 RepID=A0ACB9H069_CICIN|nr:hypothetical protein L2E82_01922 [Cichorium intybus]
MDLETLNTSFITTKVSVHSSFPRRVYFMVYFYNGLMHKYKPRPSICRGNDNAAETTPRRSQEDGHLKELRCYFIPSSWAIALTAWQNLCEMSSVARKFLLEL